MIEPTPGHIAVLIPNLVGGGAQRFAVNIAHELSSPGHRVDLVVGDLEGSLLEAVSDDVELVGLGHTYSKSNLLPLARYLRRARPDALLAAQPGANVIAVLAKKLARVSTRIVITHHTSPVSLQGSQVGPLRTALLDRLSRWAYPRAGRLIAVSEGVARGLTAVYGIPAEAISVVYNPVINSELVERFNAAPDPRVQALFGSERDPVVVAVGRLVDAKGFDTLIEGFSLVRAERSARLLIMGEGPNRPALMEQIEILGLGEDVAMPGHIANPLPAMKRASVFAMSSRNEGLPTALIEALYAGAPIVSTDCHSGPREILSNGDHGLLVPVDDPVALAAGIGRALDGQVRPPQSSSWRPFEGERIAAKYERLLLQEAAAELGSHS